MHRQHTQELILKVKVVFLYRYIYINIIEGVQHSYWYNVSAQNLLNIYIWVSGLKCIVEYDMLLYDVYFNMFVYTVLYYLYLIALKSHI